MSTHRFRQVDVFGSGPFLGNPVAVVQEADSVSDDSMQLIAQWTNLSETTFLTAPRDHRADYAVRIFTNNDELPFAGHPTLGSAHAWLEAGGVSQDPDRIVQECGIGLVALRRCGDGLAFQAPPLLRSGPPDESTRSRVLESLEIDESRVVDVAWVDNGPGWLGVLVDTAASVDAVKLGPIDVPVGVIGPEPAGGSAQFRVRALFPVNGVILEDPVTGSLNASLAVWLLGSGRATAPYVAAQGSAIGRSGRVHVDQDVDGAIWVGGATRTAIEGSIEIH